MGISGLGGVGGGTSDDLRSPSGDPNLGRSPLLGRLLETDGGGRTGSVFVQTVAISVRAVWGLRTSSLFYTSLEAASTYTRDTEGPRAGRR